MVRARSLPQVYKATIEKERRGDFLGKTVQVVPHVTNAIQEAIMKVSPPHWPAKGAQPASSQPAQHLRDAAERLQFHVPRPTDPRSPSGRFRADQEQRRVGVETGHLRDRAGRDDR